MCPPLTKFDKTGDQDDGVPNASSSDELFGPAEGEHGRDIAKGQGGSANLEHGE